jgi:hypothetical protein
MTSQGSKIAKDNPILFMLLFIVIPTIIFAVMDEKYWATLSSDFGLKNSWHLLTVDLQAIHNNQVYTYTYPNSPFLLYLFTVILFAVVIYREKKPKKSNFA